MNSPATAPAVPSHLAAHPPCHATPRCIATLAALLWGLAAALVLAPAAGFDLFGGARRLAKGALDAADEARRAAEVGAVQAAALLGERRKEVEAAARRAAEQLEARRNQLEEGARRAASKLEEAR